MSAVQSIRAKSGTSPQKARPTAPDEKDSDEVALAPDEAADDAGAEHAPPPPGMGKLIDKTI